MNPETAQTAQNTQNTQNIENLQNGQNQENTQNNQNSENSDKTAKNEQKPKKARYLGTNFFILFGVLVIVVSAIVLYRASGSDLTTLLNKLGLSNNQGQQILLPTEEPTTSEPVTPPVQAGDEWRDFVNTNHEFILSYPPGTELREPIALEGQLKTYEIVYTGSNQSTQIESETDLVDGYIVRLTTLENLANQNLKQIAIEKRNNYLINCPESAKISNIEDLDFEGYEAKRFNADNCNLDYIETLLIKDNVLFEFTQMYRGDVGVVQTYKAATDEIIEKFQFTNVIQPSPLETWTTYTSGTYGFDFKYPSEMDSLCCNLNGPVSESDVRLIVLADRNSVTEGQNLKFTGFAVYIEKNPNSTGFGEYVDLQKSLLIENYRAVTGREPVLSEESVRIGGNVDGSAEGGIDGLLLKGYAWWGEIIFAQLPNRKEILVISKTELHDGELTELFDGVLESFGFN